MRDIPSLRIAGDPGADEEIENEIVAPPNENAIRVIK